MSDLISRKQAVDALKRKQDDGKGDLSRFYNTIIQHDIEAIMQLPSAQPEQCEDAVSRNLVLSEVKSGMIRTIEGEDWKRVSENVRDIKAMPPVTPKQRTGKWIKLDMHRGMADHKCTACEQECYVPTCMGEPLYAFCPNCGSYNGGEQDDSF